MRFGSHRFLKNNYAIHRQNTVFCSHSPLAISKCSGKIFRNQTYISGQNIRLDGLRWKHNVVRPFDLTKTSVKTQNSIMFKVISLAFLIASLNFEAVSAQTSTITSTITLSGTETFTQPIAIATDGAIVAESVTNLEFAGGLVNNGTAKFNMNGAQDSRLAITDFVNNNQFKVQNSAKSKFLVEFSGSSWINNGSLILNRDVVAISGMDNVTFSPTLEILENNGDVKFQRLSRVILPAINNSGSIEFIESEVNSINHQVSGSGVINVDVSTLFLGNESNVEDQEILINAFGNLILEPSSSKINLMLNTTSLIFMTEPLQNMKTNPEDGILTLTFGNIEKQIITQKGFGDKNFFPQEGSFDFKYPDGRQGVVYAVLFSPVAI